ncbi:MAG: tail fiber domain-containing protein, partial [Dinghuibacter sp.]|nr:tail fiber domain-containing protein [Dinghuibacter sp.]
ADNARKNAFTILQNSYTGINTAQPVAILHVADSSVVFAAAGQANPSPGVPPISGAGRRMMWYADRAAFRAGFVSADQWSRDNIGDYTFATGYDTRANSIGAVATGISSTASGFTSVAMGYLATASGVYSTAFGYNNTSSGYYSLVTGGGSVSSGSYSVAFGEGVNAKAVGGFAMGRFNESTDNPNAFTAAPADRIFQIGNGNDNSSRNNAITVLRNGNMGIGTLNPARPLSFPPALGEKILLYPGGTGEVGIGVYGNELRLHCDNPGSMVSFGTQDNAGNFTQAGRFQITGGYALYVNGNIWANGITYASDERFKQNIAPIASPLEKLLQLKGVEYEMNTGSFPKSNFQPGRQMGLLAQNVEKVVPEAVHETDGYKGVDYARLVPLLIESIKEQQEQIKELKKLVHELQKK